MDKIRIKIIIIGVIFLGFFVGTLFFTDFGQEVLTILLN